MQIKFFKNYEITYECLTKVNDFNKPLGEDSFQNAINYNGLFWRTYPSSSRIQICAKI